MSTKPIYNFREYALGEDFAADKVKEFKSLIDASISFTTVSMPGAGVSFFLKYLTSKDFADFIHIDLYALPTLNQHEFYRMFLRDLGGKPDGKSDEQVFIETENILKNLVKPERKLVLIFSRFDSLRKAFDANFLSNIQSLTNIVPNQIVLIFTAIKPLEELAPLAITGGNLAFYSRILYFTPFAKNDLESLFMLDHTHKAHPDLEEAIKESGGHNQLLHIFINSHKKQNLLLDKFVRLQLRDLYDYLDYDQKKQVANIASHPERARRIEGSIDEYLLGVGYVKEAKSGYKIFSPVLEEFVKTSLPKKLPVKERLLFKVLQNKMGNVVTKDEIFAEVWPARNASSIADAGGINETDKATDWALDALIYRLRKSSFMKANGYIIESYKKVGYSLIKI